MAADESLTSEEYLELGLPAHDRVWSAADTIRAQQVLAGLPTRRQLPRRGSERSGEVFARLVSPQNFEDYTKQWSPVQSRFPQALSHFEGSNGIAKLYIAGFPQGDVGDSEAVDIMGMQFRLTVVLIGLVEEFLPLLDKNDPTYETRMKALEQMKGGQANVVSGGFESLTERHAYRASELSRLVDYMQETFPVIIPQLNPSSRKEMLLRLEKLCGDPAQKDLEPALRVLLAKVKQASDSSAAVITPPEQGR